MTSSSVWLHGTVAEQIHTKKQARYTRTQDEEPYEYRRAFLALGDDRSLGNLPMKPDILDILEPVEAQSGSVSTSRQEWRGRRPRGCGEQRRKTHSWASFLSSSLMSVSAFLVDIAAVSGYSWGVL